MWEVIEATYEKHSLSIRRMVIRNQEQDTDPIRLFADPETRSNYGGQAVIVAAVNSKKTYSDCSNFVRSFTAKLTGWLPGNLEGWLKVILFYKTMTSIPFVFQTAHSCDVSFEPSFLLRESRYEGAWKVRDRGGHGGRRQGLRRA